MHWKTEKYPTLEKGNKKLIIKAVSFCKEPSLHVRGYLTFEILLVQGTKGETYYIHALSVKEAQSKSTDLIQ